MPLDLSELATRVPRPDDDARDAARAGLAALAPSGAFGRFGELVEWLAGVQGQCPTRRLDRIRLVAMAGAPAAATEISPLLPVSPATLRLEVPTPDSGVDSDDDAAYGTSVERRDVERAFEAGMAIADDEVDSGADLIVLAGIGATLAVPAAITVAVLTGTEVASVVGRGTGIDDREWMSRCAAVRDGARVGRRSLTDGGDVLDLLSPVDSAPLAALAGLVVKAAIRRTPVAVDGSVATAAALAAHRMAGGTTRWVVAGHATPDPGQAAALAKMRLRPLLDYAISLDDGTGALLAVPQLQAAATMLVAAADR
jgi:nicotinate-nucleotide--dimethylbenzimidazole phosphoribosyltransferase